MGELYQENRNLANSIVSSFLDAYNIHENAAYKFSSWDTNNSSAWDFLAQDEDDEVIQVQMISAHPSHDSVILSQVKMFKRGLLNRVGISAAEGEEDRLEAAVGRKVIDQRTGTLIPKKDIILLVVFEGLSYSENALPRMKQRLRDKGFWRTTKGLWVANEASVPKRFW